MLPMAVAHKAACVFLSFASQSQGLIVIIGASKNGGRLVGVLAVL